MNQAYVLYYDIGEYSSREIRMCGVYLDKSEADAAAAKLNAYWNEWHRKSDEDESHYWPQELEDYPDEWPYSAPIAPRYGDHTSPYAVETLPGFWQ